MDSFAALQEGFAHEMDRLLHEHPWLDDEITRLKPNRGFELGQEGARAVFTPLIWSAQVGDRWDITRSTEFLDVSRQALYKRLKNGSVLGIPGRGTTWFPVWQFDPRRHIVRAVITSIIREFREADPQIESIVIAAWANTDNRLLGGDSPAFWISQDQSDDAVIHAARRAAKGLRT
jgi:hypothetical protein